MPNLTTFNYIKSTELLGLSNENTRVIKSNVKVIYYEGKRTLKKYSLSRLLANVISRYKTRRVNGIRR